MINGRTPARARTSSDHRKSVNAAARIALAAGLAAGVAAPASAISFVKMRINYDTWEDVRVPARNENGQILGLDGTPWTPNGPNDTDGDGFRDRNETMTVRRAITGEGVTIGMIEAAQPYIDNNNPDDNHIAFQNIDHRRIWYPFEGRVPPELQVQLPISTARRDLRPLTPGGAVRFDIDLNRHATAVAHVLVGNNENLFGSTTSFGPLTGIAPNAQLLTGALAYARNNVSDTLAGITPEAVAFTLAAMTGLDGIDIDGDGASDDVIQTVADWYGVEPWQPADVINISFGSIGGFAGDDGVAEERAGEDFFSRVCNIIAWRTDTLIVASAGDFAESLEIDTEDEATMTSPATAHNTIAVGRTGDGGDITERQDDSSFGPVAIRNWLSDPVELNQYVQDQFAGPDTVPADYNDLTVDLEMLRDEEMNPPYVLPDEGGMVPVPGLDGNRLALDLLAPGTFIELATNPANGPEDVVNTATWEDWQGTSFASAIVSGAIALMHEYGRAWEYDTSPELIKAVLLNSCLKPDGWDNSSSDSDQETDMFNGQITIDALDRESGAGILDFERLLLQYRATPSAGGYADLNQGNQEVLLFFRPLSERNSDILSPSSGPPGQGYVPVVQDLRLGFNYFERDENSDRVEVFFTDPGRAALTEYVNPNFAGMSAVRQPARTDAPTDRVDARPAGDESSDAQETVGPQAPVAEPWNTQAQPIAGDRFGFGPGQNRTTIGGNDRTGPGSVPSGGNLGPRPGGGGGEDDLGGEDGGSGNAGPVETTPCQQLAQTRCVRAGWDVGRVGLGVLDIPIGPLPGNAVVTATLTWSRIEDVEDSIFEDLLSGVVTREPVDPNARIAPPAPAESVSEQDREPLGPPLADRPIRGKVKSWPGVEPNRVLYPLVMAGTTLRGAGPDFVDLDRDKDGANDVNEADTCFIPLDPDMISFANDGIPAFSDEDSYDPLQIDMDDDGCGPPCDPNDDPMMGGMTEPGMDLPSCSLATTSGGPTPDIFDSERLRRVSFDFYNTAVDVQGIDPVALSGIVALEITRPGGVVDVATGVIVGDDDSPRRILTAAHIFDTDSDGQSDVSGTNVRILFPSFDTFAGSGNAHMVTSAIPVSDIRIHPSFNFIGDRDVDPEGGVSIENGRDDLAIITTGGVNFRDFIDSSTQIDYAGADLQVYDVGLAPAPPAIGTQEIIFAGYGESGDGRFGVPLDPQATEPTIGYVPAKLTSLNTGALPNIRAGRNVIDQYPNLMDDDFTGADDDPSSNLDEVFIFDFDDPDDPSVGGLGGASLGNRTESMITPGDSGSPSFIHNDLNMNGTVEPGELVLFGINTAASMPASAEPGVVSLYGSRGQGMIVSSYTGNDENGDPRFIDAVLSEVQPEPTGLFEFVNSDRSRHPVKLNAFKFDNLDLELRLLEPQGVDDVFDVIARSSSSGNVEHIHTEGIDGVVPGFYYLRIIWDGPVFDWSGFQFDAMNPFRIVSPNSNSNLDVTDIQQFYPSEVKYGLAWWAEIPFDRTFERNMENGGGRTAAALQGDMNRDFLIDSADIGLLLSAWGSPGPRGDLNRDGTVNADDLAIQINNFSRK